MCQVLYNRGEYFTFEVFCHCSCRHFVGVTVKDKCETLVYVHFSLLSVFSNSPCQNQVEGSSEEAPVKVSQIKAQEGNSPEKQWVLKSFEGQQGSVWRQSLDGDVSQVAAHLYFPSLRPLFKLKLQHIPVSVGVACKVHQDLIRHMWELSADDMICQIAFLWQFCDAFVHVSPWTKMSSWSAGCSKNIPWWLRPEIH